MIGAVLGLVAAVAATRVLGSLLVGITGSNPVLLIVVMVIVLSVVAIASFLPARRAAQVSPIEALRAE